MNKLWLFMMLISSIILIFTSPDLLLSTMIETSQSTVSLCIELFAIYAVWLGIFEILEQTKLSNKIAKLLNPIISFLFPQANEETKKYISLNISANLLGLGNAATPSGIKAMTNLSHGEKTANKEMILFMILNTCSLQLFPTTTISLRQTAGSKNPSDIIIPTIIVSIISVIIGVFLCFLCEKIRKRVKND